MSPLGLRNDRGDNPRPHSSPPPRTRLRHRLRQPRPARVQQLVYIRYRVGTRWGRKGRWRAAALGHTSRRRGHKRVECGNRPCGETPPVRGVRGAAISAGRPSRAWACPTGRVTRTGLIGHPAAGSVAITRTGRVSGNSAKQPRLSRAIPVRYAATPQGTGPPPWASAVATIGVSAPPRTPPRL